MRQRQTLGGSIGLIILVMMLFMLFSMRMQRNSQVTEINYPQFEQYVDDGKVTSAVIRPNRETPTGDIEFEMKDGTRGSFSTLDVTETEKLLRAKDISYYTASIRQENYLMSVILPILLSAGILIAFFIFMNARNSGGTNAKMMNFGRSRAKMTRTSNVNFTNVAGLEEEKEELEEIVDFLREPIKYTNLGARIPKGVILTGPPGTGKTLLARAVAGEAGVPFFSISGSDFVEMFVGVGASRVRDLFEDAKKNAPCIVFIDEIDAVARQRGTGLGGGHDEREQTLNQLLVEMDGFGVNEGIIVMAATNRVDILDPAILRPGRFDRKVMVGKPDVRGREEILGVHTKGKPISDDVDLHRVAQTTSGFTGADLENLMNEAAINAAREKRAYITQHDIDRSVIKISVGEEKRSKVVSERDRKITAFHEAGHAILFHVLPNVGPVHTVSIIPTGLGAGGYTMPLPAADQSYYTRSKMLEEIMVSLGGRIAEDIIFHDVTTGASQDIRRATAIARSMVTEYGMSDKVGMINYSNESGEVFIGKDLAHQRNFGEDVQQAIDSEVKRIIDSCYAKAKEIILEHEDVLHSCANLLLEKEKIRQDEFEALFGEKTEAENAPEESVTAEAAPETGDSAKENSAEEVPAMETPTLDNV